MAEKIPTKKSYHENNHKTQSALRDLRTGLERMLDYPYYFIIPVRFILDATFVADLADG